MPTVDPIAKSDQALTSTTAGDILKSFGPAAVPVVAVPSTDYSVPGAAERWAGAKTHAALQRFDWASGTWTDGIFQRISPPDSGLTPDYTHSWIESSPDKTPKDYVVSSGWNTSHAGQSADGINPSWSVNSESAFYGNFSETVPQFEWHLQYTHPTLSPSLIRSITATVLHDGSHCDIGFSGDETYFRNHTGVEEMTWAWPNMFIHSANAFTHATNNVRWLKQRMTTGVDANLINLDGNNIVRVGEAQVPSVKLQFDSPVAGMTLANPFDLLTKTSAGTTAQFLTIQSDDVTLMRPPGQFFLATKAGAHITIASPAFNYHLRAAADGMRLGNSGTSDGTEKLAFFGGTPVVKPSGELVACLTGLGLMGSVSSAVIPGPITVDSRYGPIGHYADSPTITLDLAARDLHFVTLGGDRTLAVTGSGASQRFTVKLIQSGAGGWNPTWWSGITWYTSDGLKPALASAPGKGTWVQFVTTGSGTYDGFLVAPQP